MHQARSIKLCIRPLRYPRGGVSGRDASLSARARSITVAITCTRDLATGAAGPCRCMRALCQLLPRLLPLVLLQRDRMRLRLQHDDSHRADVASPSDDGERQPSLPLHILVAAGDVDGACHSPWRPHDTCSRHLFAGCCRIEFMRHRMSVGRGMVTVRPVGRRYRGDRECKVTGSPRPAAALEIPETTTPPWPLARLPLSPFLPLAIIKVNHDNPTALGPQPPSVTLPSFQLSHVRAQPPCICLTAVVSWPVTARGTWLRPPQC